MCGQNAQEAYSYLMELEQQTSPFPVEFVEWPGRAPQVQVSGT
jgi:hypothetical protein